MKVEMLVTYTTSCWERKRQAEQYLGKKASLLEAVDLGFFTEQEALYMMRASGKERKFNLLKQAIERNGGKPLNVFQRLKLVLSSEWRK